MGKPAPKNKFSTPNASGPPKGISVCSHKISKSTPRHPPKPTKMQYFRDAAAALVSSQGSKSRLNLSGKSTPLKTVVSKDLDKSKSSSKPSTAPSTTHRVSRSLSKSVNKDRSGVNEHDTTYTVEDLSVLQTVKTRSGVVQGQLKRTGTYVVRTSEKKVKSPQISSKESPKNKEWVSDRLQKTNNPATTSSMEVSQSALRTSRSHSSSLDKLVDPIMDCVSTLEKHHHECLNAILKSCVTNTLVSRKIRPSCDNGSNDSQAAEVDAMVKELSEEYEARIEKLLSIKRHKLKEFMIVQLRKRQVKLQE